MRAELANINHCAVPFLSRAVVSFSWYNNILVCYRYRKEISKIEVMKRIFYKVGGDHFGNLLSTELERYMDSKYYWSSYFSMYSENGIQMRVFRRSANARLKNMEYIFCFWEPIAISANTFPEISYVVKSKRSEYSNNLNVLTIWESLYMNRASQSK